MTFAPVDENQLRKKKVLRISGIFIGILLLLTFFSNTINNFSLPRVSVGQPVSGALIKEVTGEGIIQARESVKEYVDQGRLVEEVKVRLGDKVEKGQTIAVLNNEELKQQLEEELLRYDQIRLNLEKISETGPNSDQGTFETNIEIAKRNAQTAQEDLNNIKDLFDAGSASKDDVKNAEMGLLLAKRDLINEYKRQSDNAKDIRSLQDSLKLEEISIGKLKKKLAEECTLVSPVDGVINELNVTKGTLTNCAVPLFSVADSSKGFELKVPVDKDKAEYLKIGDAVEINIKSLSDNLLEGKIREITESIQYMGERKDLLIDFPQEGIIGGENGEIYIGKKTKVYNMLVPNTAVGTDDRGKFVWVFNERNGPLGSEFYVRRAEITVDDSDSSKSAVLNGLSTDVSIVVKYSKNLQDGSRVIPDK